MAVKSEENSTPISTVGAGFAGVGGGTLLAVIASNLPEANPIKPWLIWIAPSVSVVFHAGWLWTQRIVASRIREREVTTLLRSGRSIINGLLKEPNITPEHRDLLLSKLQALDELYVGRLMDRIKQLHILGVEAPEALGKPATVVQD